MRRTVLTPLFAALLATGVALGGCGSEPISDEAAAILYAEIGDIYAPSGYLPEYRQCVGREIERSISPSELTEIGEQSAAEAASQIEPALQECQRQNPRFVDPEASPRELAPIRSRVAGQLARETVESGGGAGEAACIERRFEREMAGADLVRLMNAPSTDAEARQLLRIIHPCQQ